LVAFRFKKEIILPEKEKDKKPSKVFNEEEYDGDEF